MLIKTRQGYINPDYVRGVYPSKTGDGSRIVLKDDYGEVESPLYPDEIEKMMRPIVPAAPGFFQLLSFRVTNTLEWGFEKIAIVGWSRDADNGAEPVTYIEHCAERSLENRRAVLRPDGTVEDQTGSQCWDSPADWLKAVAEDTEEAAKEKAREPQRQPPKPRLDRETA
jgi:hypothetical protein